MIIVCAIAKVATKGMDNLCDLNAHRKKNVDSVVFRSLLPSNPQYPSQVLALETVQISSIGLCDLPCYTTI